MTSSTTAQLLLTARKELLKELLHKLPDDCHYQALMIANAMQIAARECLDGESARTDTERLKLESFGAEPGNTGPVPDKNMARAIRNGEFDQSARRQSLIRTLLMVNRNALSISSPKFIRSPKQA